MLRERPHHPSLVETTTTIANILTTIMRTQMNRKEVSRKLRGSFYHLWALVSLSPWLILTLATWKLICKQELIMDMSYFRVVLSGMIFALIIQSLAANLGGSTGKHLSEICKAEYPKYVKYCLWLLAETAVIAADIPEVIGTAFALNILFHIPVWCGVLITGLSTLLLRPAKIWGEEAGIVDSNFGFYYGWMIFRGDELCETSCIRCP